MKQKQVKGLIMPSSTKSKFTPEQRQAMRERALKNPYFNGEKNHLVAGKWSEEHRKKVSERMKKWNKSKEGRAMARRRGKKMLSDPANMQRFQEGKDAWYEQHPEVRVEHANKYLQPHNEARQQQAQKKHAIERAREMYRTSNVKPIIKPLKDQPDEYYDALDEFFAEGF